MAQIIWSGQSVSDLEEIYRFIARDSKAAAEVTIERIRHATQRLLAFPSSGRSVAEAPLSDMRELIVPPYRVIYRQYRGNVQIVAVLHAARNVSSGDFPD